MRHTEPNESLRARVRAGDRAAFAELYDQNARAVYSHALRLTGNWSEAEEVMSETFLAVWRTRETVDPEGGSLRPWLLGIATHKAHNANRGLRRRIPDAVDAAGRHGIGITHEDAGSATRSVLIFDKGTLAYIGSQAYFVNNAAKARGTTSDAMFSIDAVMERGVVDRHGEVPAKTAG